MGWAVLDVECVEFGVKPHVVRRIGGKDSVGKLGSSSIDLKMVNSDNPCPLSSECCVALVSGSEY